MARTVQVDLGVEGIVSLCNSIRHGIHYARLIENWTLEDQPDRNERSMYMWIASHVVKVEKNGWGPSSEFTREAIEKNYQLFLDSFTLEAGHRLFREASALHEGGANAIEKLDGLLTDQERQDPN